MFPYTPKQVWGAWWLSGRASDSGARGLGLETYLRRVVSLSKTFYSPGNTQEAVGWWLCPYMTEKLLTQHKQIKAGFLMA